MHFSAVYRLRRYLMAENKPFSGFKRQYLENGIADTAKVTIIDTKIDDLG